MTRSTLLNLARQAIVKANLTQLNDARILRSGNTAVKASARITRRQSTNRSHGALLPPGQQGTTYRKRHMIPPQAHLIAGKICPTCSMEVGSLCLSHGQLNTTFNAHVSQFPALSLEPHISLQHGRTPASCRLRCSSCPRGYILLSVANKPGEHSVWRLRKLALLTLSLVA